MRTEPSLWSRISWPNQRGTDASLEKAMFAVRLSVSPAAGETDKRTANIAFSSEASVPRWFGQEILDHSEGSVRMGFLKSGRAPLLLGHDQRRPIGVVASA